MTVCECEYCGTRQTVPSVKDEGLQALFNRANVLRIKAEFDRAADVYEKILQHSENEAEAYWGLILCKYGIEYVEDPVTFKRIPTCHRTSYDAVTADEDYHNAIRYADDGQRMVYEEEAAAIEEIQKGIIALAQKEAPYDVFICYKETDEDGNRTQDSVIANDIYYQLTHEGFKVFYAAITLEDKLGKEYEPYIFSALNSSKVMLALGTKPEYFNAVWVKNEWSRFLKIMKKDRGRLLIPCYRDMDPYELPEEFAHLQAQDMGKIGFINDLTRGIKKVIVKETAQPKDTEKIVVPQTTAQTSAIAQVKRGNMALEDREWEKADEFFEQALNYDPECAEAYLGKMLAEKHEVNWNAWVKKQKDLFFTGKTERREACPADVEHFEEMADKYSVEGYLTRNNIISEYGGFNREYDSQLPYREQQKSTQLQKIKSERLLTRAKQYAKGDTKQQIDNGLNEIEDVLTLRIEEAKEKDEEQIAQIKSAYSRFLNEIDTKIEKLSAEAQEQREKNYQIIVDAKLSAKGIPEYEHVILKLKGMHGYKDVDELAQQCQIEIDRIKEKDRLEAEQQRLEEERLAEKRRVEAKRAARKRLVIISLSLVAVAVCFAAYNYVTRVYIPYKNYKAAESLMENGEYEAAITAFEGMDGYGDSLVQIKKCQDAIKEREYNAALELVKSKEYEKAIAAFESLNGYKHSAEQIEQCQTAIKDNNYDSAVLLMESSDYEAAIIAFKELDGYKDSNDRIEECQTAINEREYVSAIGLMENGDYNAALAAFESLNGYKDSAKFKDEIKNTHMTQIISSAKVGDVVWFGQYEQDNNSDNEEGIEWVVLEKNDSSMLIISKYALDCLPYNEKNTIVTWETCTLRKWLNEEFFNMAFNRDEKRIIQNSLITVEKGKNSTDSSENETKDFVFLLSIEEVKEYFETENERQCQGTTFCLEKVENENETDNCWWWLRSPGNDLTRASGVNTEGIISDHEFFVSNVHAAVRPALRIKLDTE